VVRGAAGAAGDVCHLPVEREEGARRRSRRQHRRPVRSGRTGAGGRRALDARLRRQRLVRGRQRLHQRRLDLAASMRLMPTWALQLSGTYLPGPLQRIFLEPAARLQANVVRWAYPELSRSSSRCSGSRRRGPGAGGGLDPG
jgi:hypothetical protein